MFNIIEPRAIKMTDYQDKINLAVDLKINMIFQLEKLHLKRLKKIQIHT
jgi:hypothetical protein